MHAQLALTSVLRDLREMLRLKQHDFLDNFTSLALDTCF